MTFNVPWFHKALNLRLLLVYGMQLLFDMPLSVKNSISKGFVLENLPRKCQDVSYKYKLLCSHSLKTLKLKHSIFHFENEASSKYCLTGKWRVSLVALHVNCLYKLR